MVVPHLFLAILTLTTFTPCTTADSLNSFKHIVIFMQENRAFDHYYGMLRGVRGFDDRAATPLPDDSSLNVFHQPTNVATFNRSARLLPFHLEPNTTAAYCVSAPTMSYDCDLAMWRDGAMDAWNTARSPGFGMSYFKREDLPFYYALADAFTIGDAYYQSTMTATNPNRLFLFSGSNGLSVGEEPKLDDSEPFPGFDWVTMAEVLETAGVSWRVLQQEDNFDDNALAWFQTFQHASIGSSLWKRGMSVVDDLVTAFDADLAAGTLPQVTWIVAPADESEHPPHLPPIGEDLTARLVQTLGKYPETYAKTLFILNYDEGGQMYDHSWPPVPPSGPTQGLSNVDTGGEITKEGTPIGMGFRVPLMLISCYSRGGYLSSEVFDHTSVLQLLEKRFNVSIGNITPWRRAIAGDLLSALDFSSANCSWPDLPDTSKYVEEAIKSCVVNPPPEIKVETEVPTQEPGTRPSRALPYKLEATGTVLPQDSSAVFKLEMTNAGTAGAMFNLHGVMPVRKYSLLPDSKLVDEFWVDDPSYAYSLFGPNGFVRQFGGDVEAEQLLGVSPRVTVRPDSTAEGVLRRRMVISVSNPKGMQNCTFVLKANAYRDTRASFEVSPALHGKGTAWNLDSSGGWYDFTVQALALNKHNELQVVSARRYMGRLENGEHSISDPAAGTDAPRAHTSKTWWRTPL